MSSRAEREKSKMQEKYQVILAQLLKEDDNRFCVDCDTKSPRWASWNLGIFICIRCAGFHRNLGVHISRVKSVNLDSWTAEQIASMQAMGNNRARAVYEAHLPTGFRRPQADSALEAFIRAKYEQRKWIAKDWIPPEIMVSSDLIESESNNTRRHEPVSETTQPDKVTASTVNNIPRLKGFTAVTPTNAIRQIGNERPPNAPVPVAPPVIEKETLPDLLGLDEPSLPTPTISTNTTTNKTALATVMTPTASSTTNTTNIIDPLHELFTTPVVATTPASTGLVMTSSTTNDLTKDLENAFTTPLNTTNSASGIMTTEKIMALYNTPSPSIKTTTQANTVNVIPTQLQQQNLLAQQKPVSFGNNLYQTQQHQQGTHFPIHGQNLTTQSFPYPAQPNPMLSGHSNSFAMSAPTVQSPASNFNHDQLTNQFSQFVPFANSKTNTSASALISGMPTRPVTDMMPPSSDLLWQ